MRTLLLGANGQLGRTFLEQGGLAARGDLMAASRDDALSHGRQGEIADLSNPESLPALLDRVQPNVIVNTAAYTAIDRAEQEEALATRVNGEAVEVIGHWAAVHGALVIHYSTDYVFDGRQSKPYTVDALTAPLGAYGRSKLAGELALQGSGAERDELRVVADQHGAPTDTGLIVEASLAALDRWSGADAAQREDLLGTHHLVASGATTWHGFATAIFAEASARGLVERQPQVIPISSAEFHTPAERPAWSLLDNTAFPHKFAVLLPDWHDGPQRVMTQFDDKPDAPDS